VSTASLSAVSEMVGTSVGTSVGNSVVGSLEAAPRGATVGASDTSAAMSLGITVPIASPSATPADAAGVRDGGAVVGEKVGDSVGICEGAGVTSSVGAQEGSDVGSNDGSGVGPSVGRVDGNSVGRSDGSCDGLCVGSRDGSSVGGCAIWGLTSADGKTLALCCESCGQLDPPSEGAIMTARERMSPLLAAASQAAQTSQLRHEVTTQSTGQVPTLHWEFSCVSVHAAPSSKISRLRCRMPVSQDAEQALHSCKATHTKANLARERKLEGTHLPHGRQALLALRWFRCS
jgi:hypothetical protein